MAEQPHATGSSKVEPRSPGRPPQEMAAEVRHICLNAAREVFLEKGFAAATVEEIAKRAKAGKVTLYRQFGNKETLFWTVAEESIEKARGKINEQAIKKANTFKEALFGIIFSMHRSMTSNDYLESLRLVLAEKRRFPQLADTMLSIDNKLLQPIENLLQWGHDTGEVNIPNVRIAAWQLATLSNGGVRFLVSSPEHKLEKQIRWATNTWRFSYNAWRSIETPPISEEEEPETIPV